MTRASRKRSEAPRAPSIYDVAQEARVSVFTVSAVVNNKEGVSATLANRVEAAIRKLNYRPNLLARSLARQRTQTLGVIVADIANPFFPDIVRAIEDSAQSAGYSVLLCNSDDRSEKEARYLELLLSKRVDGIILNKASGPLSSEHRQMLVDQKVPVVLLMRSCANFKADLVRTDDELGAAEATAHLARIGYRRIGLVGGPLDNSTSRNRRQGYLGTLAEHGLEASPQLYFEGDYRIDSGFRAGLALLPRRPDAVLVTNYLMTVGFMTAADEIGMRCPEDFALVSFDDYPWLNCFRPRLTTIELPKYGLGESATRVLLERIDGKATRPATVTLAPQLRVRESCGFMLRTRETRELSINGAVTPPRVP